jgi:hypothetical protein
MTNLVVTGTAGNGMRTSRRSNPMQHLWLGVAGLATTTIVASTLLAHSATRLVGDTSAAPPASELSSTAPVEPGARSFSIMQGRPW